MFAGSHPKFTERESEFGGKVSIEVRGRNTEVGGLCLQRPLDLLELPIRLENNGFNCSAALTINTPELYKTY